MTVVLMAILFSLTSTANANPECRIEVLDKKEDPRSSTTIVHYRGRMFGLVGWSHLGESEATALNDNIGRLKDYDPRTGSISPEQCKKLNDNLIEGLRKSAKEDTHYQLALKNINTVLGRGRFQTLGTENSYPWERITGINYKLIEQKAEDIGKFCSMAPGLIKEHLRRLRGPAYAAQKPGLIVEGMESQLLLYRAENAMRAFSKLAREDNSEYPPAAVERFLALHERFNKDYVVDDADIESVLAKIPDRVQKKRASDIMRNLQEWGKSIHQRNAVIAQNMIARSGNHVLLIGDAHTADIANYLLKRCQENAAKSAQDGAVIQK